MQKYDTIMFRQLIAANTTGFFDFEVPDFATIENVEIYFPQGQAMALQVNPVILQSGSQIPTPILIAAKNTNQYLSGDNVTISRKVTRPLTPYDVIRVYYVNTDLVNALNLCVDISIDYYGGNGRVSNG